MPRTDKPGPSALAAKLARLLADSGAHARHAGETTTLGLYRRFGRSPDPGPDAPGFRRSKRGNLWRRLDDGTLATVFRSERGGQAGFGWCISRDDRGPWFSDEVYEGEGEAAAAVLYELGEVDPDDDDPAAPRSW